MSTLQSGLGTSHAKIILIGEHAVVYGYPAIALPLPSVQIQATIRTAKVDQTIHSRYYDGPIQGAIAELSGIRRLIQHLLLHFDAVDQAFDLTIKSQLPAERGMGSSAATAIAIIRCLFDFFKKPLTHQLLLQWANFSEHIIHGNPSGLDAATASAQTPIWFVKAQVPQELKLNVPGFLVIADSGIKGKTGEAVRLVAQHVRDMPNHYRPKLAALGTITTKVKIALAKADIEDLGQLLTAAQTNLQALGVSSNQLDKLCQVALANQALGAKLTGGGQGGCMIAVTKTAAQAQRLSNALQTAGATQTWIQPLSEIHTLKSARGSIK
ncbi:mevalonate kinase [Agrilactobacillus fermenti]|uniref:mevalonate kinase n=1 Tax=Agrilactobacillus fermenti TaxID=2586909 RepID=UPI001E2D2069|nr:mevalonate kinase [Agrilactobacillus fermenti]MCD2255840.1 mevalonate kinase [Agrilactobacillus fermenti]